MDFVIRALTSEDEPILWEMLYHALQTHPDKPAPARDTVKQPELARYVEGWGREGDSGFVAHDRQKGQLLGAAWLRMPLGAHKGYGYIDDTTPELAFAVHPDHRKRGIGSALLTHLVRTSPDEAAISISTGTGKPVLRLYERFGFKVVEQTPQAVKMRR